VSRRAIRRIAASAAAAALCACGGDGATEAKGTPVTVEPVSAHRIVEQIQATGELLAVEEASVAAEVAGRITELRVSEGAPVAKGDVVLEIDRERRELELANERAMVAGARSEIEQVRRERDRIHTLFKSGAASQAQRDAASSRLSSAESALAAAEAKLGLAKTRRASRSAARSRSASRRIRRRCSARPSTSSRRGSIPRRARCA
jgi:multidrug efflux pump subunit AcrA (membrane-fusion protein)